MQKLEQARAAVADFEKRMPLDSWAAEKMNVPQMNSQAEYSEFVCALVEGVELSSAEVNSSVPHLGCQVLPEASDEHQVKAVQAV